MKIYRTLLAAMLIWGIITSGAEAAATLDEHQQWVTSGGKPVVAGKVYYGTAGSDPKTNAKSIFSDPALSIALANPQTTDSNGRVTNKVYIDGTYSITAETGSGVQLYTNLFNGVSTTSLTTIILSNVIGADTITATTSLGITSYTAEQQFVFKTISGSANTGAITLNVDGVGAKSVVRNLTTPIAAGEFGTNASIIVIYNATNDNFEWVNQLVLAPPAAVPVGSIFDFGGSTAPSLYKLCFGQAISRTTFSKLFAAIGTTYGVGDGSTTFNVPDLRGRVAAGQDDMGGTSANRLTNQSGGLDGDVLGASGGFETHTLTIAQMPAHTHTTTASGSSVVAGTGGSTAPGFTTTNSSSTGGGAAHNNVQPTFILNKIIFADQ